MGCISFSSELSTLDVLCTEMMSHNTTAPTVDTGISPRGRTQAMLQANSGKVQQPSCVEFIVCLGQNNPAI